MTPTVKREAHCATSGPDQTAQLTPGKYTNATIEVGSDGRITSIVSGNQVLYDLPQECAPVASAANDVNNDGIPDLVVEGEGCVSVDLNGDGSYRVGLQLSSDFECGAEGLKLSATAGGLDGSAFGLVVADGRLTQLPQALVTRVTSSDDSISVSTNVTGVVDLTLARQGSSAAAGKVKYTGFVRGNCGGLYIGFVYVSDGSTFITYATGAATSETITAPDVATAVNMLDSLTVNDCGA
mgnify:CR=1 FL=1